MGRFKLRPWLNASAVLIIILFSNASASSKGVNYKHGNVNHSSLDRIENRSLNWQVFSQFNEQTKKHIHDNDLNKSPGYLSEPQVIIFPLINENNINQTVLRNKCEKLVKTVEERKEKSIQSVDGNRLYFITGKPRKWRSTRGNSTRDTKSIFNDVERTRETFGRGSNTSANENFGEHKSSAKQPDGVHLTVPPGRVKRTTFVKRTDAVRPPLQSAPMDLVTRIMTKLGAPQELQLLTPGLIKRYDYPVEEHFVATPDGYILCLHRIPGPRHSTPSTRPSFNSKVILILHGAVGTSALFVIGKPDQSMGFLMADAGYDVWLGNFRGNTYSRNSTKFNPDKDKRFWDFSIDELAEYDIPTMVNYIRRHTRVDKIFYVGHSLGSMAFFMSASTPASVVDKIRLLVGLATPAYANHADGPYALAAQLIAFFRNYIEDFNRGETIGRTPLLYYLLYFLCHPEGPFIDTCVRIFTIFVGGQNEGHFDWASLPRLVTTLPAGTSTRQKTHAGQFIASDGLHKFDFGEAVNKRLYGSSRPPRYPLSAVTCPTALYWSLHDSHLPAMDVARAAAELPNLLQQKVVTADKFNHMDFVIGNNAKRLVYDDMMELMGQF